MSLRTFAKPCAAALLLGLALAACDDPSRVLDPPPGDGSMLVFLVLDPDTTLYPVQPVLVESIEPERVLEDLRIEFFLGGERVRSLMVPATRPSDEYYPCNLYGARFESYFRCPTLDVAPEYGSRYRLVVSAAGRPTASAEGVVPGDFEIISVSAKGDPPGTEGLEVHWTRSEGAWRYVIGIRPDSIQGCHRHIQGCDRTWFAETADTVVRTTVPREVVEAGVGTWYVDVYAMERALYEHLTTGTSGDYCSVPPVQNVDGGYGAVGAWVWRTAEVRP